MRLENLLKEITDTPARVSEVFSSLQGEGLFVGKKHLFVRFTTCNLSCAYCDEAHKTATEGGLMTPEALLKVIIAIEQSDGPHHAVSLTGGEPLTQPLFLKKLLPSLKEKGFRTYLETNGTLPAALDGLISNLDIIAMDIKLPSATGAGAFWEEHEEFLRTCQAKKVFVKVVITPDVRAAEVHRAIILVRRVNPEVPMILQPVTDPAGINETALRRIRDEFFPAAADVLEDVRIMPQLHKIWQIR
ncbi:MAG: 7-carboxy-7-deazaguanine synthase QueE [Candidatus Omnitrophica bacterium]|nr:7-carboxy-7-deazaguanine synthase QueE [Candidatus Omnitrophota bacterium]